jgi:uncharacterized cupredoxin-like copper-binding protein
MQKIVLVSFIALIMFLTTACGGPTTATQAPVQPAATQASSSAGNSTEVDVTLADNTINSSLTTFQAGVAYTFVIKNTGRHAHNFNINTPVSTAGSLDTALTSALLAVPQEQLGVGATATVQYTFPDSAAGQELEFSCLIKRHYEDGMKLSITVTK